MLRAVYRSEAMKTQSGALFDSGLWTWVPIRAFGGGTQYLWVNVTAERVDAAHTNRTRDDVDLTLRGESTSEDKHVDKSSRVLGAGVTVTGRGGTHTEGTNEQGHGGGDIVAGYIDKLTRGDETVKKEIAIYRANTKGASEEFEHDVHFRIELGTTREMPEMFKLLSVPGRAVDLGMGAIAGVFDSKDEYEQFWHTMRPWVWHDDGASRLVKGEVRLLVPQYLTTPVPQTPPAAPQPVFSRSYGEQPRWRPAQDPPATSPELLQDLHPWDVSAAPAVQRWAKVAAIKAVREPRLDQGRPWEIPGIDFTTRAGLGYQHRTSHGMLRPHITDLLKHNYEVEVGGRKVTVGFELSDGVEFTPGTEEVTHKARRYAQEDTDKESHSEHTKGFYYGAGPEGGGGIPEDRALLGRLPFERTVLSTEKHGSAAAETDEHNREGTRTFRYYKFKVTVVATPGHRPDRQLTVEVPEGLIAMFPVNEDGTLVGDILLKHPEMFRQPVPAAPPSTPAEPSPLYPPRPPVGGPSIADQITAILMGEDATSLTAAPFTPVPLDSVGGR